MSPSDYPREVVDHTARVHIEHVRANIDAVGKNVDALRRDFTDARDELTKSVHDVLVKYEPLHVWVKLLSMAAIGIVVSVFSLVGTLLWKTITNRIEDRPPVSQYQERLFEDRAAEKK